MKLHGVPILVLCELCQSKVGMEENGMYRFAPVPQWMADAMKEQLCEECKKQLGDK